MYSHEDRTKAVQLYIKYGLRAAPVIRELGYPDRKSLKAWYLEFMDTGKLHKKQSRLNQYSARERKLAVQHYLEHGKCMAFTIRELGYPSRTLLYQWLLEDAPNEKSLYSRSRSRDTVDAKAKEQAIIELCSRTRKPKEIAKDYGVQRETLYL